MLKNRSVIHINHHFELNIVKMLTYLLKILNSILTLLYLIFKPYSFYFHFKTVKPLI